MSSSKGGRRRGSGTKRASSAARTTRVADLLEALNEIAPFSEAADWDNVGLLAGRADWPARSALLAIDLTDPVAREALSRKVDALVVYHPPIFKGIRSITPDAGGPTTLLPDLLAARVAIAAVHTALDAAVGGTNDILLDAFEPVRRYPLEPARYTERQYKLVVFVPPGEVEGLRGALSAAGAGVIGNYRECSYELAGRGTFRGDESTQPSVGRKQVLEHVDEIRLETVVPQPRLAAVVRALYATHSYEEPAYDLYPLLDLPGRGRVGMGRVGELKRPRRGEALLEQLADRVDLSRATVVGSLRRSFRSVTAAAGAFGVRAFRDPASLVLTGEFKHHDALDLLRRGVTAVHLGHYESERPLLDVLRSRLRASVGGLRVSIARSDRSPFAPARA